LPVAADAADEPLPIGSTRLISRSRGRRPRSPRRCRVEPSGREQVQARDLVAGDVGERVQRDAQDLVDVQGGADRLADAVQDAHVRLDVDGRRADRAPDELAELLESLVAVVLEGERVALVVGTHENRRNLELRVALRQGDRERRDAAGAARAVRAHLDAGGAEVDRGGFPHVAALLADLDRQREHGPRRPPPLGAVLVDLRLARRLRRCLEARQGLLQATERDGLADEIEGARPHGLLRLALGRAPRDDEDRDAQVTDRLELHEVEPAHAGQAHVEEDRIRAFSAECVERRFGRVGDDGLVADLVEELPEDLADCLIVVDDQYAHRVRRERLPLLPAIGVPLVRDW
jgi:hypothetical protein